MIWNGSALGFTRERAPIAYDGNAPTLVFGPPGSSKTVGVVMCQLLDEPGRRSFVVIDPKGECAAVTARYRREVCGAENVKIINPFGVLVEQRPDLKSDGWNPLGDLDAKSPTLGDECAALGDALVSEDSNKTQPHFPNAAKSGWTAGNKNEVVEAAKLNLRPSLPAVRAALTQDAKALKKWVEKIMAGGDYDLITRLRKFSASTDELENIKSTIEVSSAWMTGEMRVDMDKPGGVSFRACTQRPTTIYVILPTQELQNKSVYLRLVLSAALRALYREGGVPTTLEVEEGFVIGHHAEILQAASILRGFGHRLTIIFQSLQQIKNLYPDTHGLFMSGAVLGFRPGDLETAEWMSKRAGDAWRASPSYADPATPTELRVKPTWKPEKRERISVGKMFSMPQGRALVWLPGDEAPRISWVRGYFDIPELAARADRNPYYTGPAAAARSAGRARWAWRSAAAAVIGVGALAAGVALGPTFEELKAAFGGGEQWAAREIHKRPEAGYNPASPRKKRDAARRAATRETRAFP